MKAAVLPQVIDQDEMIVVLEGLTTARGGSMTIVPAGTMTARGGSMTIGPADTTTARGGTMMTGPADTMTARAGDMMMETTNVELNGRLKIDQSGMNGPKESGKLRRSPTGLEPRLLGRRKERSDEQSPCI